MTSTPSSRWHSWRGPTWIRADLFSTSPRLMSHPLCIRSLTILGRPKAAATWRAVLRESGDALGTQRALSQNTPHPCHCEHLSLWLQSQYCVFFWKRYSIYSFLLLTTFLKEQPSWVERGWPGDSAQLGSDPVLTVTYELSLGLSTPQFPHQQNGHKNRNYLPGHHCSLKWGSMQSVY